MPRIFLPALLLLAACGATSGRDSGSGGSMRRVDELPEAYGATWVAWVQDAADWPERRAAALEDEALTAFLVDNLARVMLRSYRSGAIASADAPEVGPFERARAELVRLGAPAVPTLAELMAIGDGTASHLCSQLLVEIGRPALDYAATMLDRESSQERARAAELLGNLPHAGKREPALRAALAGLLAEDPDWLVRKMSAEAIGRRGARDVDTTPSRKALARGLSDEDDDVARAAVLALGGLGDPAAVPAVLNFLERAQRAADLVSYEAAQRVLRALTGTNKRRTPREWRDWWRVNR